MIRKCAVVAFLLVAPRLQVGGNARAQSTPGSMCPGDCTGSGSVTIVDVIIMINLALESSAADACPAGDVTADGVISVDEVIIAVNMALTECPTPPPTDTPTPTPSPNGQLLCSAGSADGAPCNEDVDCLSGGVCVLARGVCDGGDNDGTSCDCPDSTCSIACSPDDYIGLCEGGLNAGAMCYPSSDCASGKRCAPTQNICLGGDKAGNPCLRDQHCPGSQCAANGKVCCGGTNDRSPCSSDDNCSSTQEGESGSCQSAEATCSHLPLARTPEPTGTPPPTPALVAFTAQTLLIGADAPRSLTVADLNGDGIPDIATANEDSDSISLLIGRADHSFLPAPSSPFPAGGSQPQAIAAADLNDDGRIDLIVANRASKNIALLLSQPDHTFSPVSGQLPSFDSAPLSVLAVDVNGDGLRDLAVLLEGNFDHGSRIAVFLHQPDHTLQAAPGYPNDESFYCATSFAASDYSRHQRLDFLTTGCSETVNVLLQDRTGNFAPAPGAPFQTDFGPGPSSIAIADFNGDGRADVVTANSEEYGRMCNCVSVLLQQEDGTLKTAPGSPFQVRGVTPIAVIAADVNDDGLPDIITANQRSGTVSVLLNQPNVSFISAPGSPFAVGPSPTSVAVADVDADGRLDVLSANSGSSDVSVLLGQSDSSFAPASGSPFRLGAAGASALVLDDFNADSQIDIAAANTLSHDVTVLVAQANHTFRPAAGSPYDVGGSPLGIASADFNGDRLPDLATVNGDTVSVLLQQSRTRFAPAPDSPFIAVGTTAIAAADINRDGLGDLITTFRNYWNYDLPMGVNVWLALPDRSFGPAPGSPYQAGAAALTLADVNGDRLPDIVTSSGYDGDIHVLLGHADHTFAAAPGSPFHTGGMDAYAIAVGYVTHDPYLDIVAAGGYDDLGRLLMGTVDRTFEPAPGPPLRLGPAPSSIVLADLNGDSLLDVIAGSNDGEVSVSLQRADFTFVCAPWSPLAVGSNGRFAVAVADVNHDRRPDIVTAGSKGIVALLQVAQ